MIFKTRRIEYNPKHLRLYMMDYVPLEAIYEGRFKCFPDAPGLYFALCKNICEPEWWTCSLAKGEHLGYRVLYIGKAISLRDRWRNHHRLPELLMYA